jgi:hypothetical protein
LGAREKSREEIWGSRESVRDRRSVKPAGWVGGGGVPEGWVVSDLAPAKEETGSGGGGARGVVGEGRVCGI